MNALERAKLQNALAEALERFFNSSELRAEVSLPVFGDSIFIHMADAIVNLVLAVEDAEIYIGSQLDDKTREDLGI